MPNIKSAKKRVLISQKNSLLNKSFRSNLRTTLKKADAAIEGKSADMNECVKNAIKAIDKAANKGIIHKNNAGNKIAALTVRFNNANA